MVLVLLSLRVSVFSMVRSTPEKSLLFGRRVTGPPELQLLLDWVPAEEEDREQNREAVNKGATNQVRKVSDVPYVFPGL